MLTFGRSNIAELLTLPTPMSVVLSLDPWTLGMFAIPDESFRILSAECVVYSSDLLPAPLIFQRSMSLAIVENVLRTHCGYLYSRYFPSVLLQYFMKPVSSSANFGNLLVNRCERLHFRVIAPVPYPLLSGCRVIREFWECSLDLHSIPCG